jgi:hypothetical protein
VGPRTDLEAVAERRSPCYHQESNPHLSARSLVTILTELPGSFVGAVSMLIAARSYLDKTETCVAVTAAWRQFVQGASSHTRTLYPIFIINHILIYYFNYNNTLNIYTRKHIICR